MSDCLQSIYFGDKHYVLYLQALPPDFNMKTKVENLLKTTGFADKRSRTLGTNEFLE